MEMKSWMMTIVVLLTSCSGVEQQTDAVFSHEKPVDLSDVLALYEKSLKQDEDSDVSPESVEDCYEGMGYELFNDTSFVLKVPQYADSEHPFLKGAEDLYNSCALAFNLMSNIELVERDLVFAGKVEESFKKIGVNFLNDGELKERAQVYEDSLFIVMQKPNEECGEDDNYMTPLTRFMNDIESHAYRFYAHEDTFVETLDSVSTVMKKMTEKQFTTYKTAREGIRVRIMLKQLCKCKNFDEQCSLWLNWADSQESLTEDEWVLMVAERLMQSGKYNPLLGEIWIDWRCLLQSGYFGASRDSEIPNQIYNKMRKTCYLTCLKRIEIWPNDMMAMNSAAVLAGRVNILRVGRFMFGNDAVVELYENMPNRYPIDEEDDLEEDDEDDTKE